MFGLCKYSISETYGLFNKYGSVADVRKNTKVRDSFYIVSKSWYFHSMFIFFNIQLLGY